MDTKIKSCPFCDGKVIPPDFEDGDEVYWIDHDKDCFLKAKDINVFFDICLEAWNTRAERTCRKVRRKDPTGKGNWNFHCSGCNHYLRGTDEYCSECGAKVVE